MTYSNHIIDMARRYTDIALHLISDPNGTACFYCTEDAHSDRNTGILGRYQPNERETCPRTEQGLYTSWTVLTLPLRDLAPANPAIPEYVRTFAMRHPDALHYLYEPRGRDVMFCTGDDYGAQTHDNADHCPYIRGDWAHYLLVLPGDLFAPPVPTSHSNWRST